MQISTGVYDATPCCTESMNYMCYTFNNFLVITTHIHGLQMQLTYSQRTLVACHIGFLLDASTSIFPVVSLPKLGKSVCKETCPQSLSSSSGMVAVRLNFRQMMPFCMSLRCHAHAPAITALTSAYANDETLFTGG